MTGFANSRLSASLRAAAGRCSRAGAARPITFVRAVCAPATRALPDQSHRRRFGSVMPNLSSARGSGALSAISGPRRFHRRISTIHSPADPTPCAFPSSLTIFRDTFLHCHSNQYAIGDGGPGNTGGSALFPGKRITLADHETGLPLRRRDWRRKSLFMPAKPGGTALECGVLLARRGTGPRWRGIRWMPLRCRRCRRQIHWCKSGLPWSPL